MEMTPAVKLIRGFYQVSVGQKKNNQIGRDDDVFAVGVASAVKKNNKKNTHTIGLFKNGCVSRLISIRYCIFYQQACHNRLGCHMNNK